MEARVFQTGFSVVPVTHPRDGRCTRDPKPSRAPSRRMVTMVHATKGGRHTEHEVVPPEHLDKIMSRIPNYVEVCLQQKAVQALVDSGSDYSLLSENVLTERQRLCIVPCHATAHSVSNEPLPIVGELFLGVEIGAVYRKSHRFIVGSGLVTGVILGMDFWIRVGGFTLDLNRMQLHTISPMTSVPLF